MASCLTILQISLVLVSCSLIDMSSVSGNIGVNWGTQASHRLPPKTVVRLLQENRIGKVKLFDADYGALKALGNSGIEVMVGIPNDMLQSLATSVKAAEKWVAKNVSEHVEKHNVHIRYVAVGNEPLSEAYHGSFVDSILPALHNVQLALTKAARVNNDVIKVTVPMSADIFKSSTGLPSGGDFRSEILGQMLGILKFLTTNAAPFLVNIHPFISLYTDPHFPLEYAFFDGNIATPLNDGGVFYHNLFDASFDTLLWALGKNGYGHDMHITIGEIGWPSDGDRNANLVYAQRFNQGFMSRVLRVQGGTPMRPGMPIDAYLFSLFDEDAKSIDPGKFERHWGLFTFDGLAKYELNLGTTKYGSLVPARDVHYLDRKWCILKPSVRANEPNVALGVSYACEQADCSSLGYGTSCGELDARATTSYAYNQFYQVNNQLEAACTFNKTSMITKWDPSVGDCRFEVMVDPYYGGAQRTHRCSGFWETTMVSGLLLFLLIIM